ncbi:MAG TPA: hypothetical protein VGF13_21375 [Verrucomicrobiae bacterium]|jgi:hypothetical protein
MRQFVAILCWLPLVVGAADEVALGELGEPFLLPKGNLVEWKVAANRISSTVTIYKAERNQFSATVVSNVMALGKWTMQQRTDIPGRPRNPEKDFLHFQNKDGIGYLTVHPRYGFIDYLDEQARTAMGARARGVPNEKETVQFGREFLKKLEISERELAKKADGTPRTYGGQRARGQHGVEQVISRDVYFVRQVDGISFNGIGSYGGVGITFGDERKVAELLVVWPSLKPVKSLPVATPTEFVDYIKSGKAVLAPSDTTEIITSNIGKLVKITVNDITPFYLGSSTSAPKEIVVPFAVLEVITHFPKTNYAATLSCPLVSGK